MDAASATLTPRGALASPPPAVPVPAAPAALVPATPLRPGARIVVALAVQRVLHRGAGRPFPMLHASLQIPAAGFREVRQRQHQLQRLRGRLWRDAPLLSPGTPRLGLLAATVRVATA